MSQYPVENIRTVALVGHGSTGKTTLMEALLYRNGVIKEVGTVEKGNTVGDFDPMEKESGIGRTGCRQNSLRGCRCHQRH